MSHTVDVPAQEAYRMVRDGALLLDVREAFEHADEHAPGAELLPLGQLPIRHGDLPRDRRILAICATGNRSAVAAEALSRLGYEAANVVGGMVAWRGAGLPVRTARAA